MIIKLNIGIVLSITFLIFSCKKQGCMDEFAINFDVNAKKESSNYCVYKTPELKEYVPNFGANTATLTVIDKGVHQVMSSTGYIDKWTFLKKARFYENGLNAVSAGDVYMSMLINTSQDSIWMDLLNVDSDNFYYGHGGFLGIPSHLPNPIEWKATGDVWPAFDLFTSIGHSEKSSIQSNTPILNSSYSFNVSSTPSADSLVLEIYGQRSHLLKVIPATESSYIFSQQEIESLGKGNAILRVVSVKYDKQVEAGKVYYFLNQKRDFKEVIIE